MGEIKSEIAGAVNKIVDAELIDICVKTGFVEFVFLGVKLRTILRLNKLFVFSVSGNQDGWFDPTALSGGESAKGDPSFIFLRGAQCKSAAICSDRLEVGFDSSQWMRLELLDKDFEPLEIVGLGGERYDVLEHHYVL